MLNASITVPIDQPLGDYRMRIFGADSYFEDFYNKGEIDWDGEHDPCGNPDWAHVCDFTLRVTEAPSCMPPTNLGVRFSEPEGGELQAVLSWTANGSETAWTIYWKESDDEEYHSETLEDNSYTLSVAPQTTCEFYVVADCGYGDESEPSKVFGFTAPCLAIDVDADNPFTEGFEDDSWVPGCWESIVHGSNAWKINSEFDYVYTGSGSAYSGYYGDVYLVMPTIRLGTDGAQAQLSFWTYNRWVKDFKVGNNAVVLLDGNEEIELWVPTEVKEEWEQVTIDLTPYMGQTIRIAFKYAGDWGNAYYIDDVEVSVTIAITLANNGTGNATIIENNDGRLANVTLSDRTLWKDGYWNTLCLPFNVDLSAADCPLAGTGLTVMALNGDNSNLTDGTLTLGFTTVYDGNLSPSGEQGEPYLVAGTPYIIKWTEDTSKPTIDDPVFHCVAIVGASPVPACFTGGKFVGTYDYTPYTTENKSILFLSGNNTLYYPQPDHTDPSNPVYPTIGAFRAYFQLDASPDPSEGGKTEVRAFVLNFGDEESQGINAQPIFNVQSSMFNEEAWYDLQGRRVKESGTRNSELHKGLYIHGGKKVVVK